MEVTQLLMLTTALILFHTSLNEAISCSDTSIGLENPAIFPDNRFSSLTVYNERYLPHKARLYGPHGWATKLQSNNNDYLQLDFGTQYTICAIGTQGSGDRDTEWVSQYEVMMSLDKRTWVFYSEDGRNKVFPGNTNSASLKKNTLKYKPVARYIRIIPIAYNTWKTMRVGIFGHRKGDCVDTVGLEYKAIIPDDRFTASSFYDHYYIPSNGRINDRTAWATKTNTVANDYLQVDLGFQYVVCGIATQGSPGKTKEWTVEFKIATSLDGRSWTPYKENGVEKLFPGNTEQHIILRQPMNNVLMRFIRVIPVRYYSHKALRLELFGHFEACDTKALGMQSRSIANSRLSASSSQQATSNARLQSTSSWCALSRDQNPYLQIDLGSSHVICAVATQGDGAADQWVKSYYISTSLDGRTWTGYVESGKVRKFYANYDRTSVVRRLLYKSPPARYIRISPQTYKGAACLRAEFYGYHIHSYSDASVGVPSTNRIPNHRFTATTYYNVHTVPWYGRVGFSKTWATLTNSQDNEFLQIDLGDMYHVFKVLTQGNPVGSSWTTTYKLSSSIDGRSWIVYSEQGKEKEFRGNSDWNSIVTRSLSAPLKAKFIRVFTTSYYQHKAIRVDFKGFPVGCTSSLGLENYKIPDIQVTSTSRLDSSHDAPRGRLYSSSSWCSYTTSRDEYIEVDLGRVKTVTGIGTQGDPNMEKWLLSYSISYSFRSGEWHDYLENNATKIFTGNSNRNDVIVNWFNHPIAARYVRVHTHVSKHGHCLRFDLYGCNYYSSPPSISVNQSSIILPSKKHSSTTIGCIIFGEIPRVQWYRNDFKITHATLPSLTVPFNSAEDVVTNYRCARQSVTSRLVVCKAGYTCEVSYLDTIPSTTGLYTATAEVTVFLNLPQSPLLTAVTHQRMISINWTIHNVTDDVGIIQYYIVQLKNLTLVKNIKIPSSESAYNLTYLRPFTNFTMKIKAVTEAGHGLWSSLLTATTKITVPDGVPVVTGLTAVTSQSMRVDWQYPDLYKTNGPMAGFRILYVKNSDAANIVDVDDVRTYVLTSLEKNTYYSVTVAVRNSLYLGRPSLALRQKTLEDAPICAPILKSTQVYSATSIVLIWTSLQNLKCANGVLRGYKVIYRSRERDDVFVAQVQDASAVTALVPGLNVSTEYTFQVLGFTVKDGPGSNALWDIPRPIGNLRIETNKMSPVIRASYNETVTMSCYATGLQPITYSWTRPEGDTETFNPQILYHNVLVIKVQTPNDYGKYVCQVSNVRNESASHTVELKSLPACSHNHSSIQGDKPKENQLSSTQRNTPTTTSIFTNETLKITKEKMACLIKAELGDRVSLTCHATGQQPIMFTWMKDGFSLVNSNTVKVFDNTVVVSRVTAKDYGTYVCNVTSGGERATYSMQLKTFTKMEVGDSHARYDTAAKRQEDKTSYIPFVIILVILFLLLLIIIIIYLRHRRKHRKHQCKPYIMMSDIKNKNQCIKNKLKKLVRSDINCYEILGEEREEPRMKQESNGANIYTNPLENSRKRHVDYVNIE